MMIRANAPRAIALIACLGTAFAIGGCGDSTGTPPTPTLLGVLDAPCAEIPPGTPGGFRLLPAGQVGVGLRVAAAWPSADLVVKANGVELEKVGPSDTVHQRDLQDQDQGYWVPANIDPNPTPPAWTVKVGLPQSMRAGPLTLELTSRTPDGTSSSPLTVEFVQDLRAQTPAWNRVQLDWRDRADETGYLLERSENGGSFTTLTGLGADTSSYTDSQVKAETTYSYRLKALGCPSPITPGGTVFSTSTVDVTTPREPKHGVDTITLSRSAPNSFVYTTPQLSFAPLQNAVVSSVTNVAEDVNGAGVSLGSVRHTDSNGVSASEIPSGPMCPAAITLNRGDSSSKFNDLTVTGTWTATAVCISNALLRDRIDLEIAWREP